MRLLLRIRNSTLDRSYPWFNPLPVHVERARVPEHGQVRIPVRIQKGNDGLAGSASSCSKNTLLSTPIYLYTLSVYIILKKRRIFNSVENPDPGWYKVRIRIRDMGSGMNNPDHISESLETTFVDKNTLMRIRDGKKLDPGSGINIPDPQP
jgi:hypothetical protein